jgi:hypothetical protein
MRPAVLLLMTALVGYGQRGTEPPQYEVASIKPSTDDDFRFAFRIERDGTLYATGITLKRLMMTAYNVQGFRFIGGPGWVDAKRWDVQARPGRAAADGQIRPMLRTLLEDRFQLHAHSETRKMPVYELVVDRNGSKVPTVKDDKAKPIVRVATGAIELTNNTSATFASQGSTTAGLPPGTPATPSSTQDGPSIFAAIREQLGLRLKSARGPVEVFVIDGVQMPTAN